MSRHRRRFLVVAHQATTDPRFSLNDLTGGTGRIDVLCRAVTSALCTSHGVRDDTEVWLTCPGRDDDGSDGPRTVRIDGAKVRHLNPDERSTAALLKKAFGADVVPNGVFEEAHGGVTVAEMPFEEALVRFTVDGPVLWLDREGTDIRAASADWFRDPAMDHDEERKGPGGPGFVLSDHRPFTDEEVTDIRANVDGRIVSVGAAWLQGHQAVTLVHDELDRRRAT